MKLYNTLTRKVETFKPQDPKNVKIYTCGPTVYSYPHIGNYSSYIHWDLLIRVLKANHYTINRVLNITDVGHLSSDADSGEDKLEKGAAREGKSVWDVAEFYMNDFLKGFRSLNLVEPTKITRATDYIKQDINLVDTLSRKGFLYETSDGLYFDTSKFPSYADFAHLDLDHLKAGARVDFNSEKRNPSDFAVWKFIKPGESHAMRWDYLGRPGYPGWHLECSTIIHEELGEPIDIHTGGIDHVPVHHTNEIAQSEAAFDVQLSKFWLHNNFLTIDGEKISKSLGNIITLNDLESKGFSPLDFKIWILQGHYQSERNFTFEDLIAAKQRRLNWRNRIAIVAYQKPIEKTNSAITDDILTSLNNNLNSAEAFAKIDNNDLTLEDWKIIDEFFGLNLIQETPNISESQKTLIKDREEARKNKNYVAADKIRLELEKQGISVKDSSEGSIWQYLS